MNIRAMENRLKILLRLPKIGNHYKCKHWVYKHIMLNVKVVKIHRLDQCETVIDLEVLDNEYKNITNSFAQGSILTVSEKTFTRNTAKIL